MPEVHATSTGWTHLFSPIHEGRPHSRGQPEVRDASIKAFSRTTPKTRQMPGNYISLKEFIFLETPTLSNDGLGYIACRTLI
jgi:hypothetical protein